MTEQEHLTTGQLSAFLDKQLTPQEQAFFDAHLQSCQHCQHVLAELRGTVTLLHAMPQPPLPRSFTLPAGTPQERAARPQPVPLPLPAQQRLPRYMLQRTVRAVSTLAAAIAVLFILSGLLAGLPHGGGAATSGSAPAYSTSNGSSNQAPAAGQNLARTPQVEGATPTTKGHESTTPEKSPVASTPVPTPTTSRGSTTQGVPPAPPTLPPFLDFGQPAGRLTLGTFLLLLSIAGLIATRRRRYTGW